MKLFFFLIITLFISYSGFSNPFYFKFPFEKITELTCKIHNYEDNSNSEIIYKFTYDNVVWRKTEFKIKNQWKSLDYFIRFENVNFELYNHKRARIQTGTISESQKLTSTLNITNNSNEIIGYVIYEFNSLGYVLKSNLTYFNPSINKEIKNIRNEYQYNCHNQLIFTNRFYQYFENSHKYKRRPNVSYKLTYCNPINQLNFKDVYYYDLKNESLIIHEERIYKYNT
nr:hypothetical protein [uncultured Flavobacterium sp.]